MASSAIVVPRLFHSKELIPGLFAEAAQKLIGAADGRLVAFPQQYTHHMENQGRRAANCVPPSGFVCVFPSSLHCNRIIVRETFFLWRNSQVLASNRRVQVRSPGVLVDSR